MSTQLNCNSVLPGQQQARPSWDEYFMEIAHLVAKRSTCLRRQVGAVLVKDKNILATGYNGSPAGTSHCLDTGCLREKLGVPSGEKHELCRGLHAEQNAIIQAAKHGVNVSGSILCGSPRAWRCHSQWVSPFSGGQCGTA